MLKFVCGIILGLALYSNTLGQITVPISTLPDIGDQLLYRLIPGDTSGTKIDNQVFQTGADLQWDFSNLGEGIEIDENYIAVTAGTVADSFPNADIAIDFIGLQGYAKRNTTDISILGVAGDSVAGFPIPIVGLLDNPFVIRRAPFAYEDQFSTNSSFRISLDASVLDSIQQFQNLINQIPGTTVDSVRVTLSIDRTEDVDAWGMITIPSGVVPGLKMTQTDVITTTLEIYATTFAGSAWVNLSLFLPDDITDLLSVRTTNHLFFSDKKELVADFTMAPDSSLLSTRYARDVKSGLFNNEKFENLIDVSVYPNPSSEWVEINITDESISRNLIIQLHDISGQLIKSQSVINSNSRLELIQLNSGIHLLTIRDAQKLLYRNRLMITK